jgi:ABC-type branched-subunit amino acid transport system substrate-binding protein
LQKKPDALFVVPAYNGGHFLKQLRAVGSKIPVYGPDTFAVTEVIDIAKDSAENTICANAIVKEDTEAAKNLKEKIKLFYKKEPSSIFYSALGYDALNIVYNSLTSGKSFQDSLSNMDFSKNVLEIKGFDREGMAKLNAGLFQIKDSKIKVLE